jgi:tRNA 2-selenouridine synthase
MDFSATKRHFDHMGFIFKDMADLSPEGFDEVIDVRSPSEFAEDHVPCAVNLPVLDDAERVRIGTIYKHVGPFQARKIGAALIAQNISRQLETHFADKGREYRPLIYCWRGGQRSRSMAIILSQIGWRAETLEGGYKQYRRLVVRMLYDGDDEGAFLFRGRFVLIDGNTGSGKTGLLKALEAAGAQVIDLEGIGRHRGSVFGGIATPQPSQKAFDSAIAERLAAFDRQRPVFIEAESSRIGRISIPRLVWQQMRDSPRIQIAAARDARARYLVREYKDLTTDLDKLLDRINKLQPYQPAARLEEWRAMARSAAFEALARQLMEHHYDAGYARQRRRSDWAELGTIQLAEINADSLGRAAREAMALAGETVAVSMRPLAGSVGAKARRG